MATQRWQFRIDTTNADQPPDKVADNELTLCENGRARDDLIYSAAGYARVYHPPLGVPNNLLNARNLANNYWLYGHDLGVGVTDTVDHFDVTPGGFSGADALEPNNWTGTILNGVPIMNCVGNVPWYWDFNTGGQLLPLEGWPVGTLAGSVRAYKNHLMAMGLVEGGADQGSKLMWSDAALPGTVPSGPDAWTPTAENEAGFIPLADSRGAILDGLQLRSSFIAYKQHAAYAIDYVAPTFVMTSRKIFSEVGILARGCMTEWDGRHVCLTDGDVIVHDGQAVQSLVDRKMRRWIFNQLDSENYKNSYVVHYKAQSEIWICFVESGEVFPKTALVINTIDGKMAPRQLPEARHINAGVVSLVGLSDAWDDVATDGPWDDSVTRWNQQLFSEADDGLLMGCQTTDDIPEPAMMAIDYARTQDGDPLNIVWQKTTMALGDPEMYKRIRRIHPRQIGPKGLTFQFRLGTQENEADAITWTAPQNYTVGPQGWVDLIVEGKFISIEITAALADAAVLGGFDLEGEYRGKH